MSQKSLTGLLVVRPNTRFWVVSAGILTGLEQITDPRALTITLAWFSPVKPGHQNYRCTKLEAAPDEPVVSLGVKRFAEQPAVASVKKGTVFHENYHGAKAVPFVDDGHLSLRHCQSNLSWPAKAAVLRCSCRQLSPLSERGSAVLLEDIAAIEVAVLVEVVVDRGVSGSKLLQSLDVPEPGHRSFSPSKQLV